MAHGMVPQVRGINLKFKSGLNPEFEFPAEFEAADVGCTLALGAHTSHSAEAGPKGRSWCCDRRHKKGMRSQKMLSSKKALRGKRIA